MKSSTHYFHVKTKILADFEICISVPLMENIIFCAVQVGGPTFFTSLRCANLHWNELIYFINNHGSTNLIFACTDFRARRMVLRARLCTQKYVYKERHCGRIFTSFNLQCATWHRSPCMFYLNTKGLVALTGHKNVGWRFIKVENWNNKNWKRQT